MISVLASNTPLPQNSISYLSSFFNNSNHTRIAFNLDDIACLDNRCGDSGAGNRWQAIFPAYNSGMAGQSAYVRNRTFNLPEYRRPGRIGARAD